MRLSEVLSKPQNDEFIQIEGFLGNRKLNAGKQRKITVGKIPLNYFCKNCQDIRTFSSHEELFCIGVHDTLISIDCVLLCPICGTLIQAWFLIESEEDIFSIAPKVRVIKRNEKLSDMVTVIDENNDAFSELLEKAERAYRDGLGAGSIVYLRKILEQITYQTADAANIKRTFTDKKGKLQTRTFRNLLEKVNKECSIIPTEFSEKGYTLFGELSNVVHNDCDEQVGLEKYSALRRLVVGVLENVKSKQDNVMKSQEMMSALGSLGWHGGGEAND